MAEFDKISCPVFKLPPARSISYEQTLIWASLELGLNFKLIKGVTVHRLIYGPSKKRSWNTHDNRLDKNWLQFGANSFSFEQYEEFYRVFLLERLYSSPHFGEEKSDGHCDEFVKVQGRHQRPVEGRLLAGPFGGPGRTHRNGALAVGSRRKRQRSSECTPNPAQTDNFQSSVSNIFCVF